MTTEEKIALYLRRIGFDGVPTMHYETLCQLQQRHLLSVPYENLDIMREVSLSLNPEDLFEKIVIRRRGGYCFELNGLFAWLLRALGFTITEYTARFLRDENTIPMRRHRVLRVTCRGADYLMDVGVGGVIPRKPLALTCGKISRQGAEKYKLEKDSFLGYVLYEWRKEEWQRLYAFTEEPQLAIDFIMPSFYCEKHPESYFRTMDMVHIFTETGRKSVAGRECRIYSADGGVEIIKPESEEAYRALLLRHFGIRL